MCLDRWECHGAEGFVNILIRKVHTCCSMKCLTKIFNLYVMRVSQLSFFLYNWL
ncbi:hypothetical protein Hanom_Chr14g01271261 [Helianthus anomalus]